MKNNTLAQNYCKNNQENIRHKQLQTFTKANMNQLVSKLIQTSRVE